MTLEVTQICRTCLATEGQLVSIYQTKAFTNIGYVSDVLKELINMEPNKSDGYPGSVCVECIREINRCYSFKLKCENSYAILGQIFGIKEKKLSLKSEEEKTDPDSSLKILNQIILLPTSNNLNEISSKDTEIVMENPLQIELLQEPKTQTRELESGLIILDHQVSQPSSNDLNVVSSASEQTEASSSVVCSKSQIKEDTNVLETNQKEEQIDNFKTMIEKMVFEDETDFDDETWFPLELMDSEISKQPSYLVNGTNAKENSSHMKQPLNKSVIANNVIQPIRVERSTSESPKNNRLEENTSSLSLNEHKSIDKNTMQLSIKHSSSRYKPKRVKLAPQCAECGKVFSLLSSLQNHMLVHSDKRPYICKVCKKTFRNKSTFKLHELRHETTKPFKCDECDSTYVCMKELKYHTRIHSDKNLYACKFCAREFRYMNALKCHLRSHTGDKPYACAHCPKRYSQLQSLGTHHERHNEFKIEEMNNCKYCKEKLLKKNRVQGTGANINAEKIQVKVAQLKS